MGDTAKGRVDEEICRRDLPITVDTVLAVKEFWQKRGVKG
jgi:hypothetical protein